MLAQSFGALLDSLRDKSAVRKTIADQFDLMGIEYDSAATAQVSRRMMLALGVKAEDNAFSCGIIAARDGE